MAGGSVSCSTSHLAQTRFNLTEILKSLGKYRLSKPMRQLYEPSINTLGVSSFQLIKEKIKWKRVLLSTKQRLDVFFSYTPRQMRQHEIVVCPHSFSRSSSLRWIICFKRFNFSSIKGFYLALKDPQKFIQTSWAPLFYQITEHDIWLHSVNSQWKKSFVQIRDIADRRSIGAVISNRPMCCLQEKTLWFLKVDKVISSITFVSGVHYFYLTLKKLPSKSENQRVKNFNLMAFESHFNSLGFMHRFMRGEIEPMQGQIEPNIEKLGKFRKKSKFIKFQNSRFNLIWCRLKLMSRKIICCVLRRLKFVKF